MFKDTTKLFLSVIEKTGDPKPIITLTKEHWHTLIRVTWVQFEQKYSIQYSVSDGSLSTLAGSFEDMILNQLLKKIEYEVGKINYEKG